MVVKHCSHGVCQSDSRYARESWMTGVTFHRFPNKELFPEACSIWVDACGRENLSVNNVSRYTFMCSRHFNGGKGPTVEHPNPMTTKATPEQISRFLQSRRKFQRFNKKTKETFPDVPQKRPQDESNSCSTSASRHLQSPNCDKSEKIPRTYGKEKIQTVQSQGCVPAPENAITNDLMNNEDTDAGKEEDETCVHTHSSEEENAIGFQLFGSPCKIETHTIDLLSQLASPMLDILRSGWNIVMNGTSGKFVFTLIDGNTLQKKLCVDVNTGLYELHVAAKHIPIDGTPQFPSYLSNNESVLRLLHTFKEMRICVGVGISGLDDGDSSSSSNRQHGTNCTYFLPSNNRSSVRIRCENCSAEIHNLRRKARRKAMVEPQHNVSHLRLKAKMEKYKRILIERKLNRTKEKLKKALEHRHILAERGVDAFPNVNRDNTSTQHLSETNKKLLLMIQEQQKAAACNNKGMRWHPEVLQWAAYMRNKSASYYESVRKSGFFCLPSATTLRRVASETKNSPPPLIAAV